MKHIAVLMSALLLLNAADGLGGYAETTEANRGICEEMAAKIGVPADQLDAYMTACVNGSKGRGGQGTCVSSRLGGKAKPGKASKALRKKGSKRARQLADADSSASAKKPDAATKIQGKTTKIQGKSKKSQKVGSPSQAAKKRGQAKSKSTRAS